MYLRSCDELHQYPSQYSKPSSCYKIAAIYSYTRYCLVQIAKGIGDTTVIVVLAGKVGTGIMRTNSPAIKVQGIGLLMGSLTIQTNDSIGKFVDTIMCRGARTCPSQCVTERAYANDIKRRDRSLITSRTCALSLCLKNKRNEWTGICHELN